MAKSKSPETEKSSEKKNDNELRKFIVRTGIASLIASGVLTLGANMALREKLYNEVPTTDSKTELPAGYSVSLESKDSAGLYDVIPSDDIRMLLPGLMREIQLSETETRSITDIIEKPSKTTKTTYISNEDNEQGYKFARKFGEEDPENEIQARGEDGTRAMAEWITEMQDQGWEVDGVTIVSTASAESHMNVGTDNNPGLGIKNPENERLAILRGKDGKEELLEDITKESDAKNASSIGKLVTIKGKEIEDKKLNSDIFKLSEELHIGADDLIMMYNTGENLPELADEILDRLADDRYVLYRVEMSKDIIIEGPSEQIVTTETVNVTRETQIVYVIVPAFIPVPRGWKKVVNPPPETNTPRPRRDHPTDDPRRVGYIKDTPIVITQPNTPSGDDGKSSGGSFEARREYTTKRGDKRGGGRVKGGQAHRSGRRSGQGHRGKKAFTR